MDPKSKRRKTSSLQAACGSVNATGLTGNEPRSNAVQCEVAVLQPASPAPQDSAPHPPAAPTAAAPHPPFKNLGDDVGPLPDPKANFILPGGNNTACVIHNATGQRDSLDYMADFAMRYESGDVCADARWAKELIGITGDRREIILTGLKNRARIFEGESELLGHTNKVHDTMFDAVRDVLYIDYGLPEKLIDLVLGDEFKVFTMIWNDISKESEDQVLHGDASTGQGSALLYATGGSDTVAVYIGNGDGDGDDCAPGAAVTSAGGRGGSRAKADPGRVRGELGEFKPIGGASSGGGRMPSMRAVEGMDLQHILERVAEAQGISVSHLEAVLENDPHAKESLVSFWLLLVRSEDLNGAMRKAAAFPDTLVTFGGAVPHYGTGAPKGVLRLVFLASFSLPGVKDYDVDFQVTKVMMLIEMWCFREALQACLEASHTDDAAAHYAQTVPGVAEVVASFLSRPASRPPSEKWLSRHAVQLREAYARYMLTHTEEDGGPVYVPPTDATGRYHPPTTTAGRARAERAKQKAVAGMTAAEARKKRAAR